MDAGANASRAPGPIPVVAPNENVSRWESALGSNWNPVNWIPNAAAAGGEALGSAGMPGAGAALTTAGAAVPLVLGGVAGDAVKAVSKAGSLEDAVTAARTAKEAARIEPTLGEVGGKAGLVEAPYNPATIDIGGVGAGSPGPAPFTPPTIADAPSVLQAANAAKAAGKAIDPVVQDRHVTAQTLPVPVKLTEGQATMNPTLISNEMNGRGKGQAAPVSPEFYQEQSKALGKNLDVIQSTIAPDIADTGKTTLGQTLVDAYKNKDAPIQADISAKYQALADANGGTLPIDGQAFVTNTDAALSKALKSGSLPSDIQSSLNEFRNGRQMTMEDFEQLRSDTADAMRNSTDGRARAAAGIVRQQLENMPLTPEAAALKPLADAARSAAKARFDALEKDPAYKAAVNDPTPVGEPSPLADNFTDGYVIRGKYANVKQMRANLANDSTANQSLAAAQLEHLRTLAKADPTTGAFNQAGYNNGITAAGPKLAEVLGPDGAYYVKALGDTAKLVKAQPPGAFVNNSNSATALLAEGAKAAATHSTNMLFGGLPVGSIARTVGGKVMDSRAATAAAQRATAPGAGMTSLSEVGKR